MFRQSTEDLKPYFKQIGKAPLLTADQEKEIDAVKQGARWNWNARTAAQEGVAETMVQVGRAVLANCLEPSWILREDHYERYDSDNKTSRTSRLSSLPDLETPDVKPKT